MSYPALPGRRMPYDTDGTTVIQFDTEPVMGENQVTPAGAVLQGWQSDDFTPGGYVAGQGTGITTVLLFPEQREVVGIFFAFLGKGAGNPVVLKGSADSTNGLDGTWEQAILTGPPTGAPTKTDDWRGIVGAVSFTGAKKVIRLELARTGGIFTDGTQVESLHVYGEKAAGQTVDDIIFLDADGGGAEYTADEDFGDRALGSTVIRQFKVKNDSGTKTANAVNLQCNDTDFAISDNAAGPWVATYDIASLAPGASSVMLYTRNTTPGAGAVLGPRHNRIVATVGSWT